ncbi:MAG: exodeoxyribonuclease V subunit gamma, partial [Lentisphaeria bacterium]|nr:exodeoxyribonuclease V subunit gamma [Lentisphaeria bacterium]
MNEFRVIWSNRLEELAEEMLGSFETHPLDDPFQRECIVVNSRVAEGWLRHYAMYERRGRARQTVIANWDVQFLYAFINDALYRMHAGANAKREPRFHPCSRDVLRWRFHGLLGGDQLDHAAFAPLRDYLHGDGEPDPRRRFALAGTLAQLFDEYQVYRPDMLARWQKSQTGNLPDNTHWQPPLWEALRQQNADTYLKLFLEMGNRLPRCGVLDGLRRLSVFAVPGMPPVYLHFLKLLSEHVPVSLYLFNPCQELWDEDLAPKARERAEGKLRLQGREDEVPYLETGNPLLSSLGKACQSQLGEVLDFTGGNIAEPFHSQPDDCTLHVVQNDLLQRRWTDDRAGATLRDPFAVQSADESISIHICHSAMRELEVLRDQLLRWFSKEEHGLPGLQPRQIQVLCPNIEDYAPYIDAVFGTEPQQRRDPHTIPYVIADRTATGTSPLANAFLALLALPESRFSATQVADLLQNEAVCAAFEIRGDEVQALRQWIHECGIRWGLDSEHRKRLSGADFTQVTTWRHGLDRMLLGYAMAPSGDETPDHAGTLGTILPFSKVEGDSGVLLGKLARFVNCLEETLNTLAGPVRLEVWGNRLDSVLDTFFANTNETYADLTATRNAIRALVRQSEAADFAEPVLAEVVLAFMREQLEQMDAPGNTIRNAVVFSALRPMHCMPRRVVWLLGMDNGVFPRPDIRASFDLMRQKCHRGDPSRRNDDRSAFLEALLAAREHFHISYVGRTDANELIPPSTLVCELREYLIAGFERADATDELPFPETQHRLQPFHPAYFGSDSALFSYSRADCQAARALQNSTGESFRFQEPPLPAVDQPPKVLLLRELTRFLRDPAAAFYRNALNVRFDDRDTTQLDDSELFEADTLQRYTIDNTILQAILSGSDSATLRDALEQKGTIPLGEAGAQWLEKRREEVEEFLDQPVPDDLHPGTIRELLEIPVREESILVSESRTPPPGLPRSDAEPPVPPPPGLS